MTTLGTLSFGSLPVPKSYVGPFARYTTLLKLSSSTTYHTCRLLYVLHHYFTHYVALNKEQNDMLIASCKASPILEA